MRRGEIWTVSGAKGYAGKPRPVVILHDDRFDMTDSMTVCPITADPTDIPLFRLPVAASEATGLPQPCRLMIDKITTVPKAKLGVRIGSLAARDIVRVNRAVLVFLGIAGLSDTAPG